MKKIIFTFLLILLTATSHADMSDKEISDSLKCAGIFTSTQFIKQGELPNGDLAYKENSLAAAKVTREFLTNEGVLRKLSVVLRTVTDKASIRISH